MLDTNLIIIEILPYLLIGEIGKESEIDRLNIVEAIFYRLKTGCQWRLLPIKQFTDRVGTTWNAVYHHYSKWCKDGSWQRVWANVDFNKRNGTKIDREEYFDEILYQERFTCEHPFAWMDAYKVLLVRYEKLSVTWLSMNIMGMLHLLLRKKHIIKNG